jgi:hypothetical protein
MESFEMWCWRGMEISWTIHVRNEVYIESGRKEYPTYNKKKEGWLD